MSPGSLWRNATGSFDTVVPLRYPSECRRPCPDVGSEPVVMRRDPRRLSGSDIEDVRRNVPEALRSLRVSLDRRRSPARSLPLDRRQALAVLPPPRTSMLCTATSVPALVPSSSLDEDD